MGGEYFISCMDCQQYLCVGKVWWIDDNRDLSKCTFDGVFDFETRTWKKRDEFFGRTIEKFLIIHRNHELRFIAEEVDDFFSNEIGFFESVEPQFLQEQLVDPEPDPDLELEQWKIKLKKGRDKGSANNS